jgi:C4-dicarboxylate transporter DctM subunit
MIATILIVTFVAVLAGIPFAFSLLIGIGLATLVFDPTQLSALPSYGLANINDPLLVAIPMLIIAGEMLSAVGAMDPLILLMDRTIGRFKGSLGLGCVATSLFFAGSTGSSSAEAAAVASAFHDPMVQRGYRAEYVGTLIAASTVIGVLFPPSLAMILYAEIVQYPVTDLWRAGIEPGVVTAVLMAVLSVVLARRNFRADARKAVAAEIAVAPRAVAVGASAGGAGSASAGSVPCAGAAPDDTTAAHRSTPPTGPDGKTITQSLRTVRGTLALVVGILIPVFVVGGVYSGIVTLSETSAVLVFIVVLYGLLITRCKPSVLLNSARRGGQRAGAIFLIIVAARLFSSVLVRQQAIEQIINYVGGLHVDKFALLLAVNVALLIAGILMDGLSLILIAAPILVQLVAPYGITPVHLAIIMAVNIEIAVIHPPFGSNLFAVSAVTGVSVGRLAVSILPYIGLLLVVLALVTYVPVPGFAWN